MMSQLPICCGPVAFKHLRRCVGSIASTDGLLQCALAVGMQGANKGNCLDVKGTLESYADTIRQRVKGKQGQALLAHMHEYLFEELKISGNKDNCHSMANLHLPSVLITKKGLPVTLSLIYKFVAERLGFKVQGIGLAEYFVACVEFEYGVRMYVDAFDAGRILNVADARQIAEGTTEGLEWSDALLRPVSHKQWVTRITQTLLGLFQGAGQYNHCAAILEMEMLLWPDTVTLQRDLGLVLARIGKSQEAAAFLSMYIKAVPDDPQLSDLKDLLDVLRQ